MRLFDRVEAESVEQRDFHLAIFSLSVIAILAAGIAILMYPTIASHPVAFSARTSKIFFIGFCGLCTLLLGYLIERQIVVRRLRQEIVQGQARYAELRRQAGRDMLATLSGMNHFQDRLVMEYKRALNGGDSLSIMVVLLSPTAELPDEREVTGALGDAVKAINRRLRREDSLYHFSARAFGIIMPGVNVKDARLTATRLAEGLNDAAGALDRFTSEIKVFNYPQTAATAHELQQAVRSLLPKEMISEPALADSFVDSFQHKM
jgi:GGDEF domain-containing protein